MSVNLKLITRSLFCTLLIIIPVSTKAQTSFAIEAQKLAKYGKINQAIEHWKQDYAITKDHWNAYEIAKLYAIAQSQDSTFVWLYKAAELDSSLTILTDDYFYPMLETQEWRAFELFQTKKYEAKNGEIKNIALARKLWHINMKDQAYSAVYQM
ncbi:MAG: hypothetical protein GC192_06900 [Bacteroidetes bacterium]|nr:hypothetical protein [Bacteroidota bacterium]